MNLLHSDQLHRTQSSTTGAERGFTLIETMIALIVMMVISLGVASLFIYSVRNNTGASERALAMAVAQQQLEQMRSVNFDDASLNITPTVAPTPAPAIITSAGRTYQVVKTVTGVPAPVLNASNNCVQPATAAAPWAVKQITITVTPRVPGQPWMNTPVTVMTQRSSLVKGKCLQ